MTVANDYRDSYQETEGQKFARDQIDLIKQLGFTHQQAYMIMNAGKPLRCAPSAQWAVDVYTRGYRIDWVEARLKECETRLIKSHISQRPGIFALVFGNGIPIPAYECLNSMFGFGMFAEGAVKAMELYEGNSKP